MGSKTTINNASTIKEADIRSVLSVCPKKLTHKQELFCREYVANGYNATQAAIKAGYSPKTAYSSGQRLLKHVEIKSALEKHSKMEQEKFNYTKEAHFKELDELKDLAKQTGNVAAAVKATELKGKLCGLYIEKVEALVKAPVIVDDIEDVAGE